VPDSDQNEPTTKLCVHEELSAALRSQKFNLTPTQQADLDLPVLFWSSLIDCDGILYSPTSTDTHKSLPSYGLYSDGDFEWRSDTQT